MPTIDTADLDDAISSAFQELRTAMRSFNRDSIQLYSAALEALVKLRQVTP
ncbi:hypothetical protein [Goekera deserti]|uniref:hypothetical protein n=1 Tax=Goekera deserti TaxID=2497753 RepID=UPI001575A12B|nr:hypothetical protein [Goekera deserti]